MTLHAMWRNSVMVIGRKWAERADDEALACSVDEVGCHGREAIDGERTIDLGKQPLAEPKVPSSHARKQLLCAAHSSLQIVRDDRRRRRQVAVQPPSTVSVCPGDIRGSIRCEKEQRPVELADFGCSCEGGALLDARPQLRILQVSGHCRGEVARREGVDTNASGGPTARLSVE